MTAVVTEIEDVKAPRAARQKNFGANRSFQNWLNPYVTRISEFQGRVFCFDAFSKDVEAIRVLCKPGARIFCEIGSGSGRHLIARAKAQPEDIFFGIELRYKRAVRTVEKAARAGVSNLYVLQVDAELIGEIFGAHSLSGVYIYFPDPWLKRRTWKHRVLRKEYLHGLNRLLCPGAFIDIKTDAAAYFNWFLEEMKDSALFSLEAEVTDLHRSEYAAENIQTEFESLFVAQGLPIHFSRLIATSS